MDEQPVPPGHYQIRVSQQYTRANPLGGKPLEGWRTLTLTFAQGTAQEEIEARAREAAYAAELAATILDAQVAAGATAPVPALAAPPEEVFAAPDPAGATPRAPQGPPAEAAAARAAHPLTEKQLKAIYAIGRNAQHLSDDEVDARCQAQFGCRPADLSRQEASQFITSLQDTGASA
jgi:hypothetical protein